MSNEKKKDDFFNLNSSSSDEEEDEAEKLENEKRLEKNVRKWDWDREENFKLYYSHSQGENDLKKIKTSSEEKEDSTKARSSASTSNSNKNPYVENVLESRGDSTGGHCLLFNLNGHNGTVNRIHWKKGNKNILLSSSMDMKIMIWDLSSLSEKKNVRVLPEVHTKSIRNAIWSNNATEIVSVSYDQTCALTDVETGSEISRLKYDEILTSVCGHPSNEHLIQIGSKNCILNWDDRSKTPSKLYKGPIGFVQDILFLNEQEFLTSGDVVSKESAQYALAVWDFASGAQISDQIYHEKYICTSLCLHPHQSLFFAQTHGNYIAEFMSRKPYKMNKHKRFESGRQRTQGYYIGCDVNASGCLIASGSIDGGVYVYNVHTSQLVERVQGFGRTLAGGEQPCMDVKFKLDANSNKSLIAASGWNGQIKIFEL